MECRQQPLPVLTLLLSLEVRAFLYYPQFIVAFSNLKNSYWFFWKPISANMLPFKRCLKMKGSRGYVLITFPLCASIPWCFRIPSGNPHVVQCWLARWWPRDEVIKCEQELRCVLVHSLVISLSQRQLQKWKLHKQCDKPSQNSKPEHLLLK